MSFARNSYKRFSRDQGSIFLENEFRGGGVLLVPLSLPPLGCLVHIVLVPVDVVGMYALYALQRLEAMSRHC